MLLLLYMLIGTIIVDDGYGAVDGGVGTSTYKAELTLFVEINVLTSSVAESVSKLSNSTEGAALIDIVVFGENLVFKEVGNVIILQFTILVETGFLK